MVMGTIGHLFGGCRPFWDDPFVDWALVGEKQVPPLCFASVGMTDLWGVGRSMSSKIMVRLDLAHR